jgi:hypothetical protein
MSECKVQGQVHVIEESKTFGQKGFRKRLVVLEQDKGRYTNYLPIDFTHDGCDAADELSVGDEIEVPIRLSGRKWQRDENSEVKFFLSAEATEFKILRKGGKSDDRAPPRAKSNASAEDYEDAPF